MASTIAARLQEKLGDKVAVDAASLDARRHDYWFASHVHDHVGDKAPPPACIVRPTSVADVQTTLAIANAHKIPVIPFGLGSGVVGGVVTSAESILLDMGSMNRVRSIDEKNLLASFDAGKNGLEAEQAVAQHGLTIGHWPQSVAISTVGGWIATRASGQFSTANGNIEDIVHSIEAVLPDGTLVVLGKGPRAAAGPDLRHIMMGSEGTLGVITGVTYSLRRAAEAVAYSAFEAPDMGTGFEFQRRMIQAGWRPPVVRQYDERESKRQSADAVACVLLMVHEGPNALVEVEQAAVTALARDMGVKIMPASIVEHWMANRNVVPSWDMLLSRNLIADTVEVSADWDQIGKVYDDAVASLNQVPGIRAASAHSSHLYRSGLNLYFTFVAQLESPEAMESTYFECWRQIMDATVKNGGSAAHHHGIGRVRRDVLNDELGAGGVDLLRKIKQALDPNGIMNPGVLLPDA